MSSNLGSDAAHCAKAKNIAPGIEDKLMELKGIGQLLGHLCDRSDNDFTHTFYFLGAQVERLTEDIGTMYDPTEKKHDPDWIAGCARCRQLGQRHATVEARLREYLLAVKALHDCGAETDSPEGTALWERIVAVEEKIKKWNSDEPAAGIAKLIISMSGEIHKNLGSQFNEAMVPVVALSGLRWFNLEELYNECYPSDAAKIKKALLEKEDAS